MPLEVFQTPYKPRPRTVLDIERQCNFQPGFIATLVPQDNRPSFAYVGGSLADGFGNSTSDIDLFGVYNDDVPQIHSTFAKHQGISVQYVAFPRARVDELIQQINLYKGMPGDLSQTHLQFIHRLASGVAVSGHELKLECLQQLDMIRFRYLCSAYHEFLASNKLVDAQGAAADANWDTMVFAVRAAVGHQLDVLLAELGETTPNDKWRYDKAKRALLPVAKRLIETYFQFDANVPVTSATAKQNYLNRGWEIISRLSDVCVLARSGVMPTNIPRSLLTQWRKFSATGLQRKTAMQLKTEFDQPGFFLYEQCERVRELSPAGAALWMCITGSRDATVVYRRLTQLQRAMPTWLEKPTQISVTRVINEFIRRGWVLDRLAKSVLHPADRTEDVEDHPQQRTARLAA
jgi:hypothetical protein